MPPIQVTLDDMQSGLFCDDQCGAQKVSLVLSEKSVAPGFYYSRRDKVEAWLDARDA